MYELLTKCWLHQRYLIPITVTQLNIKQVIHLIVSLFANTSGNCDQLAAKRRPNAHIESGQNGVRWAAWACFRRLVCCCWKHLIEGVPVLRFPHFAYSPIMIHGQHLCIHAESLRNRRNAKRFIYTPAFGFVHGRGLCAYRAKQKFCPCGIIRLSIRQVCMQTTQSHRLSRTHIIEHSHLRLVFVWRW